MREDHALHFLVGFILCWMLVRCDLTTDWVVGIVLLIAILKEVYDYFDYGVFEPQDIVFTIVGMVLFKMI